MSISTYAALVSAAETLANRPTEAAHIDLAITMFEAVANRELRTPDMEATATSSTVIGEEAVALPDDFRSARSVRLDTDPVTVLQYMAPQAMRDLYAANVQAQPQAVTVEGLSLVLAPVPDAEYDLTISYYQSIPALTSTNTTNWLLTKHPDAYVAGTLAALNKIYRDDDASAYWEGMAGNILALVNREGYRARTVGPMRMRPTASA